MIENRVCLWSECNLGVLLHRGRKGLTLPNNKVRLGETVKYAAYRLFREFGDPSGFELEPDPLGIVLLNEKPHILCARLGGFGDVVASCEWVRREALPEAFHPYMRLFDAWVNA